jgi:hypothetical protein
LKRAGYDGDQANHIANITLVDDYLNKRQIGDKPPATYMSNFSGINPRLPATMQTHLIDLSTDGIWENDYDMFFKRRCERIARQIHQRIARSDSFGALSELSSPRHEDRSNDAIAANGDDPPVDRCSNSADSSRLWIGRHVVTGEVFYRLKSAVEPDAEKVYLRDAATGSPRTFLRTHAADLIEEIVDPDEHLRLFTEIVRPID